MPIPLSHPGLERVMIYMGSIGVSIAIAAALSTFLLKGFK